MNRIKQIENRYFRIVPAHPEGAILHHGDCSVFGSGICDCGLLHDLRPLADAEELYPDVYDELGEHDEPTRR